MRRHALALGLAAALLLPAAARAGTSFGVTEDAGKYAGDGGAAFFGHLRDLGMTESAVSVRWNPDRPATIEERAVLDRFVATAGRFGMRVVFAVYFTRPTAVSATPQGPAQFASFLRTLARAYPDVKDFVVGNEPNYAPFWQPQFTSDGRAAAGALYEQVLARSYDSLKGVDPRIDVVGMGLAARGNDLPYSRSPSTSPVLFLRDVGAAYRRSGRTRPLMDTLAYHPYPASALDSVDTKQAWPAAGVADLGRLKQAVWDAFYDTPQPTFANGLTLKITEVGWQAAVPAADGAAYHGYETARTTDEARQARIYGSLVRALSCDPAVTDVLFFHLVDEADLRGFQSGMLRADGSARPAFAAVRQAIAQTGGRCSGTLQTWAPTSSVVGATVSFDRSSFVATAQEATSYRAAIVRVEGAPTAGERDALQRSLQSSDSVAAQGPLAAYRRATPAIDTSSLAPGTYVETVLLQAVTDPQRTSFFVSDPFTVGSDSTAAPAGTDGKPASASDNPASATGTSSPQPAAQGPQFVVAGTSRIPSTVPSAPRNFTKRARRARAVVGPSSAAFSKLPGGSVPKPGRSSLESPASADRTSPAARPTPSVEPAKSSRLLPTLLVLAALVSVIGGAVAVRVLR